MRARLTGTYTLRIRVESRPRGRGRWHVDEPNGFRNWLRAVTGRGFSDASRLLVVEGWEAPLRLRRPGRRYLFGTVFALTAALGADTNIQTNKEFSPWITYTADVGDSLKKTLPDGSRLHLNTNSEVRVQQLDHGIYVILIRGEVSFERPPTEDFIFQVRVARSLVATRDGTFTVRVREDQRIETLVSTGEVLVEPFTDVIHQAHAQRVTSPRPFSMRTGDLMTISANSQRFDRLSSHDLKRRMAWKSGFLWFEGETLVDALAEFNRYNQRQLVVADATVRHIRIGGRFRLRDADSFLGVLRSTFGVGVISSGESASGAVVIQLGREAQLVVHDGT